MIISEKRLRRLVRRIILEQVVGYQAPQKRYDDPIGDETSDRGSSEAVTGEPDSDATGYMQIGDVSIPTGKSDTAAQKTAGANLSPQDQSQMRTQMANLQRQRQASLNKGDSKQADYYGIQLKRIKDVLNPV